MIRILTGDCADVMKTLPAESVDAIVTDPPYGLEFMGNAWDGAVPGVEVWRQCLRVLKPGGHLLAFAGTRTQHRMACAIEDAGFEIRDLIAWLYGSGFPKSLDVSKAIDKAAGAEREVVGSRLGRPGVSASGANYGQGFGRDMEGRSDRPNPALDLTAPATDAARQWSGWGTALKPSFEPVTVARKPLIGTVAANVLTHGTGALNIDACRVKTTDSLGGGAEKETTADQKGNEGWTRPWMDDAAARADHASRVRENVAKAESLGRWPANCIHDGSDEVVAAFPETTTGSIQPYTRSTTPAGYALG